MSPFNQDWLDGQLKNPVHRIIGASPSRQVSPCCQAAIVNAPFGAAHRWVCLACGKPVPDSASPVGAKGGEAAGIPPKVYPPSERKDSAVPRETEAGFQAAVIEYAHLKGWVCAHFRPARAGKDGQRWITAVGADGKGFPDLVLVRDIVIFAELKSDRGKLRPEQEMWADRLSEAGCPVYIWRPEDWPEIRKVLE